MTKCEEGILRTLAFFDGFDYAPTLFELWRWQLKTDRVYTVEEIRVAVEGLEKWVDKEGCLYGLRGRSLTARMEQRRLRTLHGIRKNKKVFQYVGWWARFVFGVKGVAICNTRLPFLYAEHNSDIDLLVVAKRGRLWSVRFLLVAMLKLLRKRPGAVMADAFDHSIFISDARMDVERVADINPVYVAAWTASVDPVYGNASLWKQFAEENAWIEAYFPAYAPMARIRMWRVRQWPFPFKAVPERLAAFWQKEHLTPLVKKMANASSAVMFDEDMLKFHTNDKRQEYENQYKQLCATFGITA